ncbi:MAG: hypothetical protein U9R75_12125, partial [Candidatus Thermoplasmatota archaeon]|nr:hypothetical protein [Candidatus Thermoplasmatota archaeon]
FDINSKPLQKEKSQPNHTFIDVIFDLARPGGIFYHLNNGPQNQSTFFSFLISTANHYKKRKASQITHLLMLYLIWPGLGAYFII